MRVSCLCHSPHADMPARVERARLLPAPFYDNEHSPELNSKVLNIVLLFNAAIKKYVPMHGFKLIDVCTFTTGCDGFSNGSFHVDNRHLGAKAISEIEQQLN